MFTDTMSQYTDDFKEELLGYNLVVRGICSIGDLRSGEMSYEDVLKCNEALSLKSKLEGFGT